MKASMFLVALVATLSVIISQSSVILAQTQEPQGTSTMKSTYFGVDANDKEAVKKIQFEISSEKWREMMGDIDINSLDFTPVLHGDQAPKKASEVLAEIIGKVEGRLQKAVQSLHDLIFKPSTTTPTPVV